MHYYEAKNYYFVHIYDITITNTSTHTLLYIFIF